MSIVDKVLKRLEKKKERQASEKTPEQKEREAEVWALEGWLIGSGNAVSRKRKRKSTQQ